MLGRIDRSSPRGKRDYALLLLAYRLGLRAGDIRTLTLDHLDWANATLRLTQSKTTRPLVLPLTEEIGQALIDYLKSGRPQTPYREIFLRLKPPVAPFSSNSRLYDIVSYWRRLAGITFHHPQRQGLQSLRHSLATHLLQQDTPLPVIAAILGHTSLDSTRLYAKADVQALRSVAVDVEELKQAD